MLVRLSLSCPVVDHLPVEVVVPVDSVLDPSAVLGVHLDLVLVPVSTSWAVWLVAYLVVCPVVQHYNPDGGGG